MPLPCKKPRYRFKETKKGVKQRLAFCGNKIVEVVTFKGKKKKPKRIKK